MKKLTADYILSKYQDIELIAQNEKTAVYLVREHTTGTSQTDARSDIYSLGVLATELLTGQLPSETIDLTAYGRLGDVIKKTMRLDPSQRFATASLLKKALLQSVKTTHTKRVTYWLASAIGVLAVLGTVWANSGQGQPISSANAYPAYDSLAAQDTSPETILTQTATPLHAETEPTEPEVSATDSEEPTTDSEEPTPPPYEAPTESEEAPDIPEPTEPIVNPEPSTPEQTSPPNDLEPPVTPVTPPAHYSWVTILDVELGGSAFPWDSLTTSGFGDLTHDTIAPFSFDEALHRTILDGQLALLVTHRSAWYSGVDFHRQQRGGLLISEGDRISISGRAIDFPDIGYMYIRGVNSPWPMLHRKPISGTQDFTFSWVVDEYQATSHNFERWRIATNDAARYSDFYLTEIRVERLMP